jgi:hypothetical protein
MGHGRSYGLNLLISTFFFLSKYEDFAPFFPQKKPLLDAQPFFFVAKWGNFTRKKILRFMSCDIYIYIYILSRRIISFIGQKLHVKLNSVVEFYIP